MVFDPCKVIIKENSVSRVPDFQVSSYSRIELSSGVGSWSRELRESPELAVSKIIAKKELGCAKKTSCLI
jgi:hypothetical protein